MSTLNVTEETPVWQLTVGQFKELMRPFYERSIEKESISENSSDKILVGIQGLASYLEVSRATAQNYKSSGILDGSYTQIGRTIRFDADLVDEAIKKHRNNM
jgi:hypothetical protein